MLPTKTLFKIVLLSCSLFLCTVCFSQSKIIEINDSTGLHSYAVLRGDTLSVIYDTAYILNGKTFKLLQDNYKRVQNGNPELKGLFANYDALIDLQDSMLKSKEMYYQQLKGSFDSLVGNTTTFVKRTDMNINTINQSLSNATTELNSVKSLLNDSLNKLKQENKQKFKLAVGAFTVGIGISALIFLIAK